MPVLGTQSPKSMFPDFAVSGNRTEECATFLRSPRALAACMRELEHLTTGLEKRATTLGDVAAGHKPEVRRSPGRCMVQVGPVALSVSWLPGKPDTVLEGRLLVIEWEGTVGRGGDADGGRGAPPPMRTATPVREQVLFADATSPGNWRWSPEGGQSEALESTALVDSCIDSLMGGLKKQKPADQA
jgi:hypothetical protein